MDCRCKRLASNLDVLLSLQVPRVFRQFLLLGHRPEVSQR
jgi:hypothetical protein